MTPAFVSKKYPLPATAVNCVEPSATTTACQSVPAVTEPPKETAVPLIVILEFAK